MFIAFGAHYIETTFTALHWDHFHSTTLRPLSQHYIETIFTVVEITSTVFTLFLQHELNPFTTLVNGGANTTYNYIDN